jgi:hypothetical protein
MKSSTSTRRRSFPTRPGERESSPRPPRARVRADRHRRLRGGPVLRRGCRVREGRADDVLVRITATNRGPESAELHPAADSLVSRTPGRGTRGGPSGRSYAPVRRRRLRRDRGRPRLARRAMALLRGRSRSPLHRERHERRAPLQTAERAPIREGLDQCVVVEGGRTLSTPRAWARRPRRTTVLARPGRSAVTRLRLSNTPIPGAAFGKEFDIVFGQRAGRPTSSTRRYPQEAV